MRDTYPNTRPISKMLERTYFILADIVRHDQSERNRNDGERKRKRVEDAKKKERKGREPLDCLAVVIPAF